MQPTPSVPFAPSKKPKPREAGSDVPEPSCFLKLKRPRSLSRVKRVQTSTRATLASRVWSPRSLSRVKRVQTPCGRSAGPRHDVQEA